VSGAAAGGHEPASGLAEPSLRDSSHLRDSHYPCDMHARGLMEASLRAEHGVPLAATSAAGLGSVSFLAPPASVHVPTRVASLDSTWPAHQTAALDAWAPNASRPRTTTGRASKSVAKSQPFPTANTSAATLSHLDTLGSARSASSSLSSTLADVDEPARFERAYRATGAGATGAGAMGGGHHGQRTAAVHWGSPRAPPAAASSSVLELPPLRRRLTEASDVPFFGDEPLMLQTANACAAGVPSEHLVIARTTCCVCMIPYEQLVRCHDLLAELRKLTGDARARPSTLHSSLIITLHPRPGKRGKHAGGGSRQSLSSTPSASLGGPPVAAAPPTHVLES